MFKTSAAILGLQLSCIVAKLTVQHIFSFMVYIGYLRSILLVMTWKCSAVFITLIFTRNLKSNRIVQIFIIITHVRVLHFNTNLKSFESMNNELNELFCNERSDYLYLLLTVWLAFIRSFYFEKTFSTMKS